MGDAKVADWVSGQLQQEHDKPFFLACGIYRPHLPWYVPKKYFDMHPLDEVALPVTKEDDLDDIPAAGRAMVRRSDHRRVVNNDKWREAVQAYLACVSFADACVGRVIEALEASACRDNTLVVLWSDHGWHLGEKLHWRKFALWEEATRNALVFAGPGIAPGQRCEAPVNLIDIYPTLIDCCGLGPREGLDGLSLKPLIENPDAPWERPSLTTHMHMNHALRTRRWRYIRYKDGSEELYDHSVDKLEWTNLAADPAYADIKRDLGAWLQKTNAP
jgi:arylsulfatase A-like enzyme